MKRLIVLLIGMAGWFAASGVQALTVVSDRLMAPVMETWLQHFPAKVEHRVSNTLTAVQQLIQGNADLIAIGRSLSDGELQQLRQLRGRTAILSLPVGMDAIAIYVPRHSPLKTLTLARLARLFGSRPCHRRQAGPPAPATPPRFGLTSATAGHWHFVHRVLCDAPLHPGVTLVDSDLDLIRTVAGNRNAIGFASAAIDTEPGIRPLAVKNAPKARAYLPVRNHLRTGRYPLTHFLYLHLLSGSTGARNLARFGLSPRGQTLLDRRFVALPKPARTRAMEILLR